MDPTSRTIVERTSPAGLAPTESTVLRSAFGCLPSGVVAVCAAGDDPATGMLVSSMTPVSLDPPLLSFCVQDGSRTWARLRRSHRIRVSVLGDVHEAACADFARPADDRLADIAVRRSQDGAVVLEGAPAVFVCSVHDEIPAGDHSVVLVCIDDLAFSSDVDPLIFHRSGYRRLVR